MKNIMTQRGHGRTCGLFALMTCTGFFLTLQTIKHNESPTQILTRTTAYIWSNLITLQFFKHAVCAMGYDMYCNVLARLCGQEMSDLIFYEDELSELVAFTFLSIGLARFFIDLWHGVCHRRTECSEKTGTLNPKNEKFDKLIMKDANHLVVEQSWSKVNKLRCLKNLGYRKFEFALVMLKELWNYDKKLQDTVLDGILRLPDIVRIQLNIFDAEKIDLKKCY